MIYLTLRFDDATRGQYLHAFPEMKKYGMKGSIYAIGRRVDDGSSFLQIPELLKMQDGGWEVGYHSLTHNPDWINHPEDFHKETDCSKLKNAGLKIDTFCFPHSAMNRDVIEYVSKRYKASIGIPSSTADSMYRLPRDNLFHSFSIRESVHLHTIKERIEEAIRNNEYLILMFHKITDDFQASDAISTDKFNRIIKAIDHFVRHGDVKVVTLREAKELISKRDDDDRSWHRY